MIYNKIESTLVITKQIFNYYNTDFSLEIKSEVEKLFKNTHHKMQLSDTILYFSSNVMKLNAQDSGIS